MMDGSKMVKISMVRLSFRGKFEKKESALCEVSTYFKHKYMLGVAGYRDGTEVGNGKSNLLKYEYGIK